MSRPDCVYVLFTCERHMVSIFTSKERAEATRNRYNADPFLAHGEPDRDAPYTVECWAVSH